MTVTAVFESVFTGLLVKLCCAYVCVRHATSFNGSFVHTCNRWCVQVQKQAFQLQLLTNGEASKVSLLGCIAVV